MTSTTAAAVAMDGDGSGVVQVTGKQKEKIKLLHMLSEEVFKMVVLHLKPRHSFKLMQADKKMYTMVKFHPYYWTRTVAHLVLRDHVILPEPTWYSMVLPPTGYHKAMESFLTLIPEYVKKSEFADDGYDVSQHADLDMFIRCCAGSSLEPGVPKDKTKWGMLDDYDVEELSAKKILKMYGKKTRIEMCGWDNNMRDLLRFIEDDPDMTRKAKKELAVKITSNLSYNSDWARNYTENQNYMKKWLRGLIE